jgi:hypothetical protein
VPLERNVHGIEPGGVELGDHFIGVVHVRRHERIAGRLAPELIGHAVGRGHALANPAQRANGQRRACAAAPLKHADAVGADGSRQAPQQREPLESREPLQHVIADDEVERPRRGKEIVRMPELDVRETAARRFRAREIEHHARTIDRDHRSRAPRERQREPAGPAAVLERGHRRELRRQAGVDHGEHPRDDRFPGGEEEPLVFGREVRAEKARIGDDREVRFAGGEALPAVVSHRSTRLWHSAFDIRHSGRGLLRPAIRH